MFVQGGELFFALYKQLDQTAATPAMHKNTASRKISRLSSRVNALSA
ncbi:MAG: 30S ribosomal protein S20 [Pseudomonadota bacterium]